MLAHSALSNEVTTELDRLQSDVREPFSKRFEALWILWQRGGRSDFSLLDRMFKFVAPAGQPSVMDARHKLSQCFEVSFSKIQRVFDVPASSQLNISLEQFQELSRTHGAIRLDDIESGAGGRSLPSAIPAGQDRKEGN